MELPSRERGDELLKPGEFARLLARLRSVAPAHDLTTVIACAFDHRTRMLPFLYADLKMAPAGVRAIGSAMAGAGFAKTRIVLQQWNRNFRPSQMRLDGRVPDLFLVSSMLLHSAQCDALLRDAGRIDPSRRPLIIAGGPRVVYEPWGVFGADPADPWGADVAVTGEEFVLMSLLEVLLSTRASGEPMRSAFLRARDSGALDAVPGLVYARTGARGRIEELVDTGVQRLLGDLDELPDPVLGFSLLEPPGDRPTLGPAAIPPGLVRRHSPIGSLVLTQGCRFHCAYCPIPAYNQRQLRAKSGERIAEEIERLFHEYHLRLYFGTDDNFFADAGRAIGIAEALARKVDAGSRPHAKIRLGTEATIHDTLKMKDHLPMVRKAGVWAVWLGVEDMSGALVRKGQDADRTVEAFRLLRQSGIFPVPMLMHHDEQPLVSWKKSGGLLNQVGRLRRAGALSMQVLMLTPSPGSKSYEESYISGLAYRSVGGREVGPELTSGTHVIASRHPRPWVKQLNLLAAYVYFFNPLRFLWALVCSKSWAPIENSGIGRWAAGVEERPLHKRLSRRLAHVLQAHLGDAAIQVFGMLGLAPTLRRTLGWAFRLLRGRIERSTAPPRSPFPMRAPAGSPASHALPGTPLSPPSRASQSGTASR
jgi:radical SAM superfamily enzyme YgiQ (UPF0313 family)